MPPPSHPPTTSDDADSTAPPHPTSSVVVADLRLLRFDEERTHIALRGALDVAGTRRIEPLFIASVTARRLSTVVEFAEVTFLSSYAMCMLVMASRAIRLRGRVMVLVAPAPQVLAVLRATRLHHLIPIVHTVADADDLVRRWPTERAGAAETL